MTSRLNDWSEKYNKVTEYQAAYRKGVGCQHHVFTLNAIFQNHLKNKKNVMYALFIDLSKAFDRVNHAKLWNKLASIGISTKFIESNAFTGTLKLELGPLMVKVSFSILIKLSCKGNVYQLNYLLYLLMISSKLFTIAMCLHLK
jgi:hypothetical protein